MKIDDRDRRELKKKYESYKKNHMASQMSKKQKRKLAKLAQRLRSYKRAKQEALRANIEKQIEDEQVVPSDED